MALDPRIALMGRGLDVGATFGNVLDNLNKAQQLKRDRALLPLEEQLRQAQIGNQQQVLTSNELANNQARQDQYISSVAQAGAEILPALNSGDVEGVRGSLTRRLGELQSQGMPTETTQEALQLLDTNPELLKQRAEQAVQLGRDRGVFGGMARESASQKGQARTVRKGDQLFSQQEIFNPNTGTIEVVETPIEGELVQRSTGLTADQRVGLAADKQQIVGDIKVGQDIKGAAGKERVKLGVQSALLPKLRKSIKLAEASAASQGEALTDLNRMEASLPTLTEVVGELKALAPIATSTFGGKVFDTAVKETGFGSTKGATARAKFISIVNNQVLPLLKPTFGGSFTVEEGDALRATMGDPDASPSEKMAQLDAFISQKERDVRLKKTELGIEAPSSQTAQDGGVTDAEADDFINSIIGGE